MLELGPALLDGRVEAPPSKSETHRALLIAALAESPVLIRNALAASDTLATRAAIEALGARVEPDDAGLLVTPWSDLARQGHDLSLDCANSGTTLRLLTGIAAARPGWTRLDGDPSLRRRPMGPLLAALAAAGVAIECREGRAPLAIRGPLRSRTLAIESPGSSQFVSALVLALVSDGRGGRVEQSGELLSRPYLEMTLAALARQGIAVERSRGANGGLRLEVPGGQRPRATPIEIPGDWSSAAFALCAGALAGRVRVAGLPAASAQADGAIVAALAAMGAPLKGPLADASAGSAPAGDWLEAARATLAPLDLCLADCPDLFPVLAVTLAHARGRSRLHGAPQLRGKESDRIALVARNLARQGVGVRELDDGIEIEGPARLAGGPVETGGDHRILMAFAAGACAAAAPLRFSDPDPDFVAAVSYPGFFADLRRLGAAPSRT